MEFVHIIKQHTTTEFQKAINKFLRDNPKFYLHNTHYNNDSNGIIRNNETYIAILKQKP